MKSKGIKIEYLLYFIIDGLLFIQYGSEQVLIQGTEYLILKHYNNSNRQRFDKNLKRMNLSF